jgi:hypothetical protein
VSARPLLLLPVLFICACGSSAPPSAKDAQATVRQYFHALVAGDADGVCRELSSSAQSQVANAAHTSSCKQASQALETTFDDKARNALRQVKVGAVHVTGNTATVSITGPSDTDPTPTTQTVPLELHDGHWQIQRLTAG